MTSVDETIELRFARRGDAPRVFTSTGELADYEGASNQVVATEELLTEWLLEKEEAEVFLGSYGGKTVGSAPFFHNFSTFLGRRGVYLEDLYVCLGYWGRGYGKAFLMQLAAAAMEWGCGHLEWWCLDWNKPSTDFYLGMGTKVVSNWIVYCIDGE